MEEERTLVCATDVYQEKRKGSFPLKLENKSKILDVR